ncbi:chorismate mutase [Streptomyces sp. NPDC001941]|uniref:chorismate mutase n=1 Tax=Streptomyces sp. NPDC001941 TaxID=3154659 RepID=UPI003332F262
MHAASPARARIDALDARLIRLVQERAAISAGIQTTRVAAGGSRLDLAREAEIIHTYSRALGPVVGRDLGCLVLKACRGQAAAAVGGGRHGFLGPAGTFTEVALDALGGVPASERVALPSVPAALEAVREGEVADAVVPLENSHSEAVIETLDELALGQPVTITGEVWLPVEFVLAARPGTALDDVAVVATHPQAFAQTSGWLEAHLPRAVFEPASSTAEAAETLGRPGRVHNAAICSPAAAARYGLQVLAPDLLAPHSAHTRFVRVRAAAATTPSGQDLTSVVVGMQGRQLSHVVTELASARVPMVRMHSRLHGAQSDRERFLWLDCSGHIHDEKLAQSLSRLSDVFDVRYLGSYPACPHTALATTGGAA